ncbi:fungal hydrophobin [Schizopora paradoxa]|uniref:Hydrophobin n=1 Tax=Schizopora paradoxa TaxID=27342 RepID=A0A0H2SC94_9AGAM|nr:fungal hydrophobin [Schizopora paradoxa]
MMFSKVAALALVPLLAVATPTPQTSQCNVGSEQCCSSTQTASEASTGLLGGLLSLLGIVVGDITGLVGVTCSPITVIGVSGTSCSAQPVCCTNNSFNGLIALGCTPININL